MRPMAALTTAMAAVLVAGAVTPTVAARAGEPAEVRWQNSVVEQTTFGEALDVAVSPDGATAYAVATFRDDPRDQYFTPVVRAVDVATGVTRWSTTLEPGLLITQVDVDPVTGQVVAGGSAYRDGTSSAVVTALSSTGEQAWTSAVSGRLFYDMAVDPTTGRVCAIASTGSGGTWTTQCWSNSGQGAFSKDYRSRSNSWPDAIVIDDVSHRVFVVGGRTRKDRGVVTTLAYSTQGRDLWKRSIRVGDDYPYVQDLAIDSGTKRLYVLMDDDRRALVIGQRTTDGKTAFTRTFGTGKSKTPRPRFVDVLPRSHRVIVTSHAKPRYRGTLRYLDKRGRQVALANFRECCNLTYPVVDPATDRISMAWGPGSFDDGVPREDEGVGAATWDHRGTKVRDLEISDVGQLRAVASLAAAGEDLLLLADQPYTSGGTGSVLVAVR